MYGLECISAKNEVYPQKNEARTSRSDLHFDNFKSGLWRKGGVSGENDVILSVKYSSEEKCSEFMGYFSL